MKNTVYHVPLPCVWILSKQSVITSFMFDGGLGSNNDNERPSEWPGSLGLDERENVLLMISWNCGDAKCPSDKFEEWEKSRGLHKQYILD